MWSPGNAFSPCAIRCRHEISCEREENAWVLGWAFWIAFCRFSDVAFTSVQALALTALDYSVGLVLIDTFHDNLDSEGKKDME